MKLLSLSYSGASCLGECERKYCHKYLTRTQKDTDFETPDYFSMGNAFHKCLELTKHDATRFGELDFFGIVKSYNLDPHEDGGRIMAMLRKYWPLHQSVGLKVAACEVKFEGTYANGIVDAVMVDPVSGAWWIVDLKTAGTADVHLPARIKRDPQLNLYATFRTAIAELAGGLNPANFAGIRYREVTKPKQKAKAGEEFAEWTSRCSTGATAREIVVPVADLDHEAAYADFSEAIARAHAIQREFIEKQAFVGKCNYKSCLNYFRPCEYFSQCYGKTYTESLHDTLQTVVDAGGNIASLGRVSQDAADLLNEFSTIEDEFI